MDLPHNIDQPFFTYGLFRPGQLAFFQLRGFISNVKEPARVKGRLLVRDGLPILDPERDTSVKGALLTFEPPCAVAAYTCIAEMEPDNHYSWSERHVDGTLVNVLDGRSPTKGSKPLDGAEWNGWDDPLFTTALDVVEETLTSQGEKLTREKDDNFDMKPLFRLQMAYLLLWSSIERYVSLRYHLGDKVSKKVAKLATEKAFTEGLNHHIHIKDDKREVYRADKPDKKVVLDPNAPKKSIWYYYQVRSNITHRGKGVPKDYRHLKLSLTELLPIFRKVLETAERDAKYPA